MARATTRSYEDREPERGPPPVRDEAHAARIRAHVEGYIGPVEGTFEDREPEGAVIDILSVPPHGDFPFRTLVTCGMSAREMRAPGAGRGMLAELYLCLPRSWPVTGPDAAHPAAAWPKIWLLMLGRFPHLYGTAFLPGETTGPLPAPHMQFTHAFFWYPTLFPDEAMMLDLAPERRVFFMPVVPIVDSELECRMRKGGEALGERLAEAGVREVINPVRKPVVRGKWLGLF